MDKGQCGGGAGPLVQAGVVGTAMVVQQVRHQF